MNWRVKLSKKNIFVINQSLFDTLNNREFVSFLNKSLVDFNDDDLVKMNLHMDDNSVDLIRDEKDLQKWAMVKPVIVTRMRLPVPAIKIRQAMNSRWSIPSRMCSMPNRM